MAEIDTSGQSQEPSQNLKAGDGAPADLEKSDQPIFFGDESSDKEHEIQIIRTQVSDKDIFRLAVGILIVAAVLYLTIGICRMTLENAGVKEVWEYSKVFLNSIISLVLGLYFGGKKQSK